MSTKTIDVAKDFYPAPAGRTAGDSAYNGERFRKDLLLPAIREFDQVVVDLDGTSMLSSSFMHEAFAGLIESENLDKREVLKRIKIKTEERNIERELILEYIKEAEEVVLPYAVA